MLTTFFSEEHEIFRKTVRDWVEKELAPHAAEWEQAELFPREVFKKARRARLPRRARIPRTSAASGGDYWYTAVWGEELVRSRTARA